MANHHEKHPAISYLPLRLLFQLSYTGTIIARLPVWTLFALIPRLRPYPQWTAKQSMMVCLGYAMLDMKSRIGITEKLSLEKGQEGSRFQSVEPLRSDFYRGPLESSIKPSVVGGTWFPQAPGKDIASKTVVLYFHGGAFVQGDGRTSYCGFPAKILLESRGADAIFSVQYRLSGYSGLNPFPAALQDALTCYLFLLNELKVPPRQIVLCGDSAGGNLALALLRYIQEFGAELRIPPPRCATLISPWVSPFDYDARSNPNRGSDFLATSFLRWGAHAYAGHLPNAASHPYITPLGQPFETPVPIFVSTGSAEIFSDVIIRWAAEMKEIKRNSIELYYEDRACHDTFLVGELLGFEASAREVASRMGYFIRKD